MNWEPAWSLLVGSERHNGTGLLRRDLWPLSDAFEALNVQDHEVNFTIRPKLGSIEKNGRPLWSGGSGKLIWFRRTHLVLNNQQQTMVCYGFGVEVGGKRIGYRLFSDGHIEAGLD